AGQAKSQIGDIGASKTKPGTVSAAVVGYFNSLAFRSLSSSTQRTYRGTLEAFRAKHGDKRIFKLERRHINNMLAEKAAPPHAANNLLKRLRKLMAWTLAEGMINADPTVGMKNVRLRSEGFLTWEESHVAQYRARYALGTRPRLALELLLCTGLRRSDAVRLGRQHVRNSVISIKVQKTCALVEIPVLPELQAAIDAMPPSEHLTYIVTEYGKAFTAAGFGGWFRERCDEAGIPAGYAAHGLRKLAATRLADSGATAHQLKAVFGWKSLRQ